jgi:hypothetical protein
MNPDEAKRTAACDQLRAAARASLGRLSPGDLAAFRRDLLKGHIVDPGGYTGHLVATLAFLAIEDILAAAEEG